LLHRVEIHAREWPGEDDTLEGLRSLPAHPVLLLA
jgi:hypothetical protein